MINIGQAVKEELERQERSVTWFATQLGCNRQAVYRIFNKYSIDTHLLMRISLILNRNFFAELSQQTEEDIFGSC